MINTLNLPTYSSILEYLTCRKPVANQQFFHLGTFKPVTSTTTEAPIIEVTSFNNNSGFRQEKQTKETKVFVSK